jgi:hypothetical protein
MARSYVELMGLEYEAERLVRSGESRAEVARLLGVHPQTLAGWALRGGWRTKDLDRERSGAITRRVVRNVAAAHAWEGHKRDVAEARLRVMREAFALIAAGEGEAAAALLAGMRGDELKALPPLDTRDEAQVEREALRAEGVRGISEARPDMDAEDGAEGGTRGD